ncbi:lipid II:glycine glycyltransferase FemX [Spirosoma fluminis]
MNKGTITIDKAVQTVTVRATDESCQYSTLTQLTPELEAQISAFLETCPGFHYFQSPAFFNVCCSSKKLTPYYVIAWQNGAIVGVLLYFRQRQFVLPVADFLTSRILIWGGPVVRNHVPAVADGLLRHYQNTGPNVMYTQVRNLIDTAVFRDQFRRYGFRYEEHLTLIVDLNQSETTLWRDVSTKRRNQIRRAEKEGCIVEKQDSLSALKVSYAILKDGYERTKLPLPDFSHFEALHQQADAYSGLRVFTVSWQGEIIGCMLCLAHSHWLFDYYAGAYRQYYKKYPNDLLPWRVLLWAKENGFTQFDFGGAGKPGVPYGVREYKKQFGGLLVNHGRYERTTYPRLFALITNAFRLWQRLTR